MLRLPRTRTRSTPDARASIPDAATITAGAAARRGGAQVLAWVLLAAGPLSAVAITVARQTVPAPTVEQSGQSVGTGASGWAEMYVRAWLSATRDDDADLTAFYPPGMTTDRPAGAQIPVDTTTLSARPTGPGAWSVVVAASVLSQGADGVREVRLRCLQVPILEAAYAEQGSPGAIPGYVAATLPSLVGCPATLTAAAPAYPGQIEAESALGQSVHGFLVSYLAGRGGLDRYLSPQTALVPVDPAPYVDVRISELRVGQSLDRSQIARPAEGVRIRVLVRAVGVDGLGLSTPLDYALTLTARAGRWETTGIDLAPQLAGEPLTASLPARPDPAQTTTRSSTAPSAPGPTR